MIIEELIEKLRRLPQHARVMVYDDEQGEFVEAVCITLEPDDPRVFGGTAVIQIRGNWPTVLEGLAS